MIETLRIGAVTYQVKVIPDLHYVTDEGKKSELHGHILWQPAEIRVADEQTEDVKVITVWHEALHGILHNAGHDDHPESLLIALSHGIVALLRDNPELSAFSGSPHSEQPPNPTRA